MQLSIFTQLQQMPQSLASVERFAKTLLVASALLCVACSPASDAATNQEQPTGQAGTTLSYEIVTETKPSHFDDYVQANRAAHYDVCAATVKAMGKQALPFPQIPRDFVMQRSTWISDGKNYYSQVIVNTIAPSAGDPTSNLCKIEFFKGVETSIAKNGKLYQRNEQANQPSESYVGDYPAKSHYASVTYSRKKTINGHQLVCTDVPMKDADICYFSHQGIVITDFAKLSIPAYMYDDHIPKLTRGTTTPVTAKFNIRIDPKTFNTP